MSVKAQRTVSRRSMLKVAAGAIVGVLASACGGPTPTPVVVEKIVEKTKVVEVTKKETVQVAQTVVVEKEKLIQVGNPATVNSDRICITPGRAAIPNGFWGFVTNTAWQFGCQTDWTLFLPLYNHFSALAPADGDVRKTDKLLLVDKRDVSADRTRIDYHIRNEAVWSDGKPITSRDVEYTLQLVFHKDAKCWYGDGKGTFAGLKGGMAYFEGKAEKIEGIQIKDDKTFTLLFDPALPQSLNIQHIVNIVPQHVLSKYAVADIWAGKFPEAYNPTVTSGPYKVSKWDPAQKYLELERRDDWWGNAVFGKPGIKRWAEKAGMGITQLLAGEVDMIQTNAANYKTLAADKKLAAYDRVQMTNNLFFNSDAKRKLAPKVQLAIAQAMDRAALREAVNFGFGEIAPLSLFKPVAPWADPVCKTCKGPMFEDIPYDPAKSKALLAEAAKEGTWDPARKLTIVSAGSGIDVLIQQWLKAIGIESEIITGNELTAETLTKGTYDIYYGFLLNHNAPVQFTNMATQSCEKYTWFLNLHFCDKEMLDIINKQVAPATVGTPAFDTAWQNLANHFEKNPFAWGLVQVVDFFFCNKDIAGFQPERNLNYIGTCGEFGMLSWYWVK